MGGLSRRDQRLVDQLLKRAERLEAEAEYQQLPRHAQEKRTAARINREHAQKIMDGVIIDG
jgi:5,10-methylene-tetrahydrofolate dehydrogenase/methenyl tetrahydrofolate cyclohydrolase